ncbi:hypothetical protein [Neobacillus cucumis]|uniref:Uncharacterized protein n=1 Tax=Neobacillus cucumis TaxID=1740721 RepID=A0A2N5HBP7_9BACI|nr:hypothetical protein [Neobacillus cucumis]PLS02936.1 hypothetical protein CVD27_17290 [Neobacillus cucumis]
MAEFEERKGSDKQEEWEEQIKEDRFNSLMFGPSRNNKGQRPHHGEESRQNQSTIDYEELMMNIDSLVDSVRGLKPLFNKVYPHIQQLWKKK